MILSVGERAVAYVIFIVGLIIGVKLNCDFTGMALVIFLFAVVVNLAE